MTAQFQRNGVSFLYPENWRIEEHPPSDGLLAAVTLEAPSGAIWTLNVEPRLRDCDELADEILDTMRGEYDELEAEAYRGEILTPAGAIETRGYELHFYYVEMVAKAIIQCFHHNGRTYMVMTQAEARDHDELDPIFSALAVSLVSGMSNMAAEAD